MHVAIRHQIQQPSALPVSATRADTGARADDTVMLEANEREGLEGGDIEAELMKMGLCVDDQDQAGLTDQQTVELAESGDRTGSNGGTASASGINSPQEEFCLQGDATKARRCHKACKQCDACHQKKKCTNPQVALERNL